MGSRRTIVALRRRAAVALAVWSVAFTMLAVAAAIPEGPTAALSVDDAYPAVGQMVHFDASASASHDEGNGKIVAFRFAFGNGQGTGWQSSALAEHAYSAEGAFRASVTVVDNRGATASASVTIQAGAVPPPPIAAPDLVPIQAQLAPPQPTQNDSVNLTVVVLNRGDAAAQTASIRVYDVAPNATAIFVAAGSLGGPLAASQTASVDAGSFVTRGIGNHTLRILVTDVSPVEPDTANNELDVQMTVVPSSSPTIPTGGGPPFSFTPLAIGLAAAAVAAAAGAAFFLLRPLPPGPLEPPPATPPDRSPPPVWPP